MSNIFTDPLNPLCPVANFIRPDKPHGCTYEAWMAGDKSVSCPHNFVNKPPRDTNAVCSNVLDVIGSTPLVALNNIKADNNLKCNLYAKCEYFNAGGSVKDRIGLRMIEEAEKSGKIKPGDYIIEPTSGNTGIGLALACAVKGYKCVILMPEKMSKEKNDVLKALGATIIRTRTSAAFDDIDSHILEAQRIMERLNLATPNCAHILDQYTNPYNPIAHYDSTAEEIVSQLNGKVDMMIATAGTGGTISGLARKLKEKCPDCIVIGVDPIGSILAQPKELNETDGGFYEVEGIGYDFIPTVLCRQRVDYWFKSVDRDSFQASRQLIRREGLLTGGSAGSALYCALKAIQQFDKNKADFNVVILLPDSVRNYMTKYLSDEWMVTRGFLDIDVTPSDPNWFHRPIGEIKEFLPQLMEKSFVDETTTCAQAIKVMKAKATDCLLIVDEKRELILHVITMKNILSKFVQGSVKPSDLALKTALDTFRTLTTIDKLKRLQCCLDSEGYAIVLNKQVDNKSIRTQDLFAVVTATTLLDYITSMDGQNGQ